MTRRIWCNGTWIDEDQLHVSPSDRGLTVGLGLFETLLAVEGHPVFLERHLARHAAACKALGWEVPDPDLMAETMGELLRVNGLAEERARIRFFRTAGTGPLDDPETGSEPLSILTAAPCTPAPTCVSVTFSKWPRNERSPLAGWKCASYAENLIALREARRQGYDETYFFNTRGEVCETATANLFVVKAGEITTPPLSSGCLPGITRQWVIESQAVKEAAVSRDDLLEADEVFLTSAIRGPVPVSRLDGREYRAPREGLRIRGAWETAIARKDPA